MFFRVPGLVLSVFLALSRAADSPDLQIRKPVDQMEAKLLYGLGNGLQGLEELYQSGQEHLRQNRLRAAERCFLEILAADPEDWEARESLARVYQALGLKEKRDSALAILRRMHLSGNAWSQSICRDIFSLSGKTIKAYEILSDDYPNRRLVLFSIQDSSGGQARFLASVSRMERRIQPTRGNPSPGPMESVPGFQISVVTERQRRIYFIAYQKPGYATMKKILADYLAGT